VEFELEPPELDEVWVLWLLETTTPTTTPTTINPTMAAIDPMTYNSRNLRMGWNVGMESLTIHFERFPERGFSIHGVL